MQPPRKYESLRNQNAGEPQSGKQLSPDKANGEGQNLPPYRPTEPPSVGITTDSGGMVPQQQLVNDMMERNRTNAARRQKDQPEIPSSNAGPAQKGDRAQLDADLKGAKGNSSAAAQSHEQSQVPSAGKAANQPNAGRAALNADFKEAKQNTVTQEQGHTRGTGHSR